jgi:hypothetical protein
VRKLPISSSSSKSAVSSGSEEGDRWGTESEDEADVDCLYCAGLFSEDRGAEERIRCEQCLKWAHTVRANYPTRAFVCDRCE